MTIFRTFLALGALATTTALAAEDRVLELPADYKAWGSYMISDRLPANDTQVISLFANDTARTGELDGGALPEGSVIVGEIYKAKLDEDGEPVESPLGRRIPADIAAIVVMERRADWAEQYPEELKLGGWEFEVFSPDGTNLNKDTAGCRECHAPRGETDYLWTIDHIRAAN